MKKTILLIAFLIALAQHVSAQCVMCKAAVESSSKIDAYTKGINNGILYMAVFPYLLIGIIGYIWYKNHKKYKKAKLEAKQRRRQMRLDSEI